MKEIPLTQGQVALVDDDDYEYLSQFKWCAHKFNPNRFYAARNILFEKEKKIKTIHMHRVVMKTEFTKGFVIDHFDHNGLNNQKSNLRLVTTRENMSNLKHKNLCSSIYTGVCWHKGVGKYLAQIHLNGRTKYLGTFETEIEAAIIYMQAVYGPNYLYE